MGPGSGSNRVKRGGNWNNNAYNCRVANRNRNSPGNANNNLGFRLVSTTRGKDASCPIQVCPGPANAGTNMLRLRRPVASHPGPPSPGLTSSVAGREWSEDAVKAMTGDIRLAAEYAGLLRASLGPRARRIILFGSRARGDAREGADFDCVVVVDRRTPEVREAVLDADVAMLDRHEQLFAALIYSEDEWSRLQQFPLAWNIRKEGVVL